MKTAGALALLLLGLAALAAVPTASAQNVQGVTITSAGPLAPIAYEGSANLPVSVEVGCATILEALGTTQAATLTVTVESPPSWLTVGEATADLADPANAAPCLSNAGSMTATTELPLTVSAAAPGVEEHIVNLVATLGGSSSEPFAANFTVAYHSNYTLVPDVTFPLTVTAAKTTFNLTVTQASNARSMVMMESITETAGDIAGLASESYENSAGSPATKVFKVTFTAPTSANWTKATVAFTAYGHYLLLDGRAGEFDAGTPMSWEFVNGGVAPEGDGEPEGDKESPAPVGALLGLGLVALAMLVRRRGA